MSAKPSVLLIGGGNMGQALLGGWNEKKVVAGVTIVEPRPVEGLKHHTVYPDIMDVPQESFDVIVLAIKPQIFGDVLSRLKRFVDKETVFLSIAAGKTILVMETWLGEASIVRVMPNTPALIGQGMSVCVANKNATATHKKMCDDLMNAVGDVVWIDDEKHMHAVTALSGSGPAYVFALIEAMQAAGEKLGLPKALAIQLARKTVVGASALADFTPDKTPAQLREQVTSPHGTTEAALKVLKAENGLDALMEAAMKAAAKRSEELS